MEVARTISMMILSIVLPLAVQLLDKRRLNDEQRGRAWNVATWACALYAFGPFSMLGWIFVTRRPWWRCLIAPLWTLPLLGALVMADVLLQSLLLHRIEDPATLGELVAYVLWGYGGMAAFLLLVELVTLAWRALLSDQFGRGLQS